MKHLIKMIAAFTLLLIVYSCQPKSEPCPECPEVTEKHPNGLYELSSGNRIYKPEFDTVVAAWDANYRSYMATDSLHYFDMPLADLTSILGHNKTVANDGVRIYMTMKNDASGVLRPHLVMLGTHNGQSDFSMMMDYTDACPDSCPQL